MSSILKERLPTPAALTGCGAALHLAATTGMRRGEVLRLRWRDLDHDAARLTDQQTLVAPRYGLTFSDRIRRF